MNNNLFFLCCGVAFLVFSIIVVCSAPIITGVLPKSKYWNTENCKHLSDDYDLYEKAHKNPDENEKEQMESDKREINLCKRHNAMYSLEYTSVIFDVILSFVCSLFGLLHYFDVGKSFEKFSGLFGLISGVICFILTLIYLIYSCYIFDNDIFESETDATISKLYSNSAIYKWDGSKYVLPYDEEENNKKSYLNLDLVRYKDLGKKQYNYNSKVYKSYNDPEEINEIKYCKLPTTFSKTSQLTYSGGECKYVYPDTYFNPGLDNQYLFNKWITSIIFSALTLVCDIGLAIFGFLLFSGGSDSKGHVPVK